MRIKFTALLRLLMYVAVGVATGVATWLQLRVADLPGAKRPPPWAVVLCAAIIGAGILFQGLREVMAECFGGVDNEQRMLIEENLKTLLVSISAATTDRLPWTELGLTAFIVRRTLRHPLGVQVRVARLRMRSTPRPTRVAWTKNKGVLGRCWRNEQDEDIDHEKKHKKYRDCSKQEWKALPTSVTEYLTYDDFKAVRDFGYVLASPIFDRKNEYRGCLVAQVLPVYKPELADSKVRELIHISADTIRGLLFGA